MTLAVYTKKPYIEYAIVSIDVGLHADIDANNISQVRKAIAAYLTPNKDILRIASPKGFNIGYVAYDRPKGLYYWVDPTGKCRTFDPFTGKLGKTMKIPARERKLIWEEETWELERGHRKKRSIERRL